MTSAGHIDLYQLTSLVDHHASGRTHLPVTMAFFSRRLPRSPHTGKTVRSYLLWAGLSRCLDHLQNARFTDSQLHRLQEHPVLGPALSAQPELVEHLRNWRFKGTIRAPLEGTPLLAGPALYPDGRPLNIDGVRPAAYCPYLEIETDLLSAKLIETPLLSLINHMTMVASKASEVVRAASELPGDRAVLEFGQRRTHPEAAVDAALAAYIGGCVATSNVEAYLRHGVPVSGTMDHFAIQAWEEEGTPRHASEFAFFKSFAERYRGADVLLVDTYDTFGSKTGIRNAVKATQGRLYGIRIDSALTKENLHQARALLDELGSTHTKIFISGGMDEHAIRELGDVPVDGYGVGERIVTSPDAPVGVGAVAKLSLIDGRPTMKLSRGSGKATLPGRLQIWRTSEGDTVGLHDDTCCSGTPLLQPVWDETGRLPQPSLNTVRLHARNSLAALPPTGAEPRAVQLRVTERLAALVETLVVAGLS